MNGACVMLFEALLTACCNRLCSRRHPATVVLPFKDLFTLACSCNHGLARLNRPWKLLASWHTWQLGMLMQAWWRWLRRAHRSPLPGERRANEPSRTPSDPTVGPDQCRKRRAEGLSHRTAREDKATQASADAYDPSVDSRPIGAGDQAIDGKQLQQGDHEVLGLQTQDEYGPASAAAMQGVKAESQQKEAEDSGLLAGQAQHRGLSSGQASAADWEEGDGTQAPSGGDRLASAVMEVVRMQQGGQRFQSDSQPIS